jgi:hypothetical protein
MKAADVRIVPALDPGESYVDPQFVLVETALDAEGDTVTTIHQVSDGGEGWTVTMLGHSVPLTHSAACEWAVSFAASRAIPLVYERDDTLRPPAGYAAAPSTGGRLATAANAAK